MKARIFYRLSDAPTEAPSNRIAQSTLSDETTKEYAKQIIAIISASPDIMKNTIKTFGEMVDNVLINPENVKKILSQIGKEPVGDGENKLEKLTRESNIAFQVLSIHADKTNNPALKGRLRILSDKFIKNNVEITTNIHTELNSLVEELS